MKNTDRDPTLCRKFIASAKEVLSLTPEVKHSWSIDEDEDHCILDIPKQSDEGFNITVEVFSYQIVVLAGGTHHHFDDLKNIDATVQNALSLVRDLLSPSMRIVEFCSNDKPYRWNIERFYDRKWHREDITGTLFYNYFGKRMKIIYQNHILPSRK